MQGNVIRILHIVSVMNRGGIETFLMNIYRHIDHSKIQFDFLVTREEVGIYDNEILVLGGKIHNIPHIRKVGLVKYRQSIIDFFNTHNEYKIVHCHMNTWAGFFLPLARKCGIPVRISHSHSSADCKTGLKEFLKFVFKKYNALFINNNATHYFACSQKAGKWLFGEKIANEKLKIINNAIDTEKFRFNVEVAKKLRKELNIPYDAFVIGHVGRLHYQKNHSFLIDVFQEIKVRKQNVILCLVGTGELKNTIEIKIKEAGLIDSVKMLGIRSDINELMMMFDVFVFPSLSEGFGNVALEAQAAGLKTIVADTVPDEIKVTEQVEFISLKEKKAFWAEQILKYGDGYKRIDTYKDIVNAGYDVKKQVKWLESFYLEDHNKN